MFVLFFSCSTRFLAGNDEEAEVNSKLAASTLGESFLWFLAPSFWSHYLTISLFFSITTGNVNIVVRHLANGEKRMCIELRERKKREELLKKMGLIDDQGKPISARYFAISFVRVWIFAV